jgi:hypothetical protein
MLQAASRSVARNVDCAGVIERESEGKLQQAIVTAVT